MIMIIIKVFIVAGYIIFLGGGGEGGYFLIILLNVIDVKIQLFFYFGVLLGKFSLTYWVCGMCVLLMDVV